MEASLSCQKFSNLEKAAPPQFNEGKPQQWCSNDWIVYNIIPPPLLDGAFVFTAGLASPTTEQGRGEKTSAPLQC